MELNLRSESDIYILDVVGDLDLYNTFVLKDAFQDLLLKNPKKVIVNVGEIHYIDSSGVGSLIHMCSTTSKKNIKMYIAGLQGQPKNVVDLAKLTTFFPLVDTEEQAKQLLERA